MTLAGLPDLLFSNSNLTFKAIGELFIFDSDDGIGAVTIARVVTLAVIAGCVRLVRNGRMVTTQPLPRRTPGSFSSGTIRLRIAFSSRSFLCWRLEYGVNCERWPELSPPAFASAASNAPPRSPFAD